MECAYIGFSENETMELRNYKEYREVQIVLEKFEGVRKRNGSRVELSLSPQ